MTIQATTGNKFDISKIFTRTTSAVLLCTALAVPGQQPQVDATSTLGGQTPMITANTIEPIALSCVVDESLKTLIKFRSLVNEWRSERGAQSTVAALAGHPSYLRIIGMGKEALPFILAELKSEGGKPDHWFWALAAISDENPVPPQSRGKLPEMAKAWLAWGQRAGHVG